jgi:hypothetical protein
MTLYQAVDVRFSTVAPNRMQFAGWVWYVDIRNLVRELRRIADNNSYYGVEGK